MPLLQKNARGRPDRLRQPLGQLALQRVKEQVRRVHQRLRLFGDRARQARMRVAERRDADAGQQVEVLAPFGVVQAHALAAHERHRLAAVGLQHMPRFARLNVVCITVVIITPSQLPTSRSPCG